MGHETLRQAAEWSSQGDPFVMATVVWRSGPSSGKPGSTSLITPDGATKGWLGGACAEPTVIREALSALLDGQPRLLQLGPPTDFGRNSGDGVVSVPMACESEGAMEVYLEPVIPAPQLAVIGQSPAAEALVEMGEALGWRSIRVVDQAGSIDLRSLTERDFVVVATQGHYDEVALEAALASPAGYVGLIASRKRADAVVEYLRGRGATDESIARIHAPAGLDLGSTDHAEMAVSVLAEIVSLKAVGGLTTGVTVEAPQTAIDPVCEMTVDIATAHHKTEHSGETYYFCAAGCQKAFEADPASFLADSKGIQ
ncbi:MAG: XdhC family protein [Acidimicrobiia bacterium]|nr:XdhC family protein [Acidimicrobiia bacterium]